MRYTALIIDTISYLPDSSIPLLKKLAKKKHLIVNGSSKYASWFKGALVYTTYDDLMNAVDRLTNPDIVLDQPSENIRYRHVIKGSDNYYILFNEEGSEVSTGYRLTVDGCRYWLDPSTAKAVAAPDNEITNFKPHELKILWIPGEK
jgi:hypothetical protein